MRRNCANCKAKLRSDEVITCDDCYLLAVEYLKKNNALTALFEREMLEIKHKKSQKKG